MIFVLCQRWMPCRGGRGGEEGEGGVGWRGEVGSAKYNCVVPVQLRVCWVFAVALCVLLASWCGVWVAVLCGKKVIFKSCSCF